MPVRQLTQWPKPIVFLRKYQVFTLKFRKNRIFLHIFGRLRFFLVNLRFLQNLLIRYNGHLTVTQDEAPVKYYTPIFPHSGTFFSKFPRILSKFFAVLPNSGGDFRIPTPATKFGKKVALSAPMMYNQSVILWAKP